ncbi:MAG: Fe-S cluster assembly protein SufD [Caulobacterales bacterium]
MSLASAIKTGDLALLPSRRDEAWRWTDLRGLIRELPPASPAFAGVLPPGPFAADEEVRIVNGRGPGAIVAAAGDTWRVALRFISVSPKTAHAAKAQITVEAGATLVLLESYEGLADGYLTETDLEIALAAGARVERIVIADDRADAVLVSRAEVTLAAGARFAQTLMTSGARRQRLETNVTHPGEGASVRLDGVYLLEGQRHADLTTIVTHAGVEGTTDQLTKGVVRDQARGVFQGRITVEPGADRTDAKMGHHALILSDRAEVDAKPELEIFADDVACAHGNTVGALDEDALFYAMQRGLPEAVATAMLTEAFVGEVVDRIEDEAAREVARAWIAERLGDAS